jgi:Alfin
VPAELPEPCLGINFARDGMARKDWLALVAVHSDSWLLAVAFYYGAKLNSESRRVPSLDSWQSLAPPYPRCRQILKHTSGFCRKQLFSQLNAEPTLFEEVNGKRSLSGTKRSRTEVRAILSRNSRHR